MPRLKLFHCLFVAALLLAACAPSATPAPTAPPMSLTMTPAAIMSGGLSVELLSVQVRDGYLETALCYPLPSDADWFIGSAPDDVFITVGAQTVPYVGAGLIEFRTDTSGRNTHRCDYIQFPITKDQDLSRFTLTVQRLVTSQPEQPDCDRAQQKLTARGIVIACQHGDQSFTFNITQKPEGMSEEEAQRLVADSFTDIVTGPWVFQTGLNPTTPSSVVAAPSANPSAQTPAINGQLQTINGVEVMIIGLNFDGNTFNADVCYSLPASGFDWQLAASPDDVNLASGGQIAVLASIHATGAEKNHPYTANNHRCARLAFPLAPNSDVSNVTLTVKKVFGFTVDSNCDRGDIRFDGGVVTFPNATGFTKCDAVSGYVEGPWSFTTGLK